MASASHILDLKSQLILKDNFDIFAEFINFSDGLFNELVSQNIVSGDDCSKIKKSDDNHERVHIISSSLMMKTSKYFNKFLEVLTLFGHETLVNFVTNADNSQITNVSDILESFPHINKSLKPEEKKAFTESINKKIRYHLMKYAMGQSKQNIRKASMAMRTQVEQSWKFQKEIKGKDAKIENIQDQISSVEKELNDKKDQLKEINSQLMNTKRQYEKELDIATKFNTANDKEIQRKDENLLIYQQTIDYIHQNIQECLRNRSKSTMKLLREASQSTIQNYSLQLQSQKLLSIFNKLIDTFKYLSEQNEVYLKLKIDVEHVIKTVLNCQLPNPSLNEAVIDYMEFSDVQIDRLERHLKANENFIFGRLADHEIPMEYKEINLGSKERKEYETVMQEMKDKIAQLELNLEMKDKEIFRLYKKEGAANRVIEVIPEHDDEDGTNKGKGGNKETDSTKKTPLVIPFSYKSNHTTRTTSNHFVHPKLRNRKSLQTSVLKLL